MATVVSITLSPPPGALAAAVEDDPPRGWVVSGISDGGVYDPMNHAVNFGPFFDNLSRTVTYHVTPPLPLPNPGVFEGTVWFDGSSSPIAGDWELFMCPPGWPDGFIAF